MSRFTPLGIKLVCWVYIVNTALFIFSLILFYSRIIIFGNETSAVLSSFLRFAFIFIPLYLYFRLRQLKKDAWFLAIFFHTFFLINNISGYLEYKGYVYSIIHITGLYGSGIYSSAQVWIFGLSTLANLFILGYIYKKRRIFAYY